MTDMQTTFERARDRWSGRQVVVVGAGRSGVSAARLLLECGARVTLTDARPVEQIAEAAELTSRGAMLVAGGHPPELWDRAEVAVFSPGIRPDAPVAEQARAAGIEVVTEIEVAGTLVEAPIIAITGSNGKSTVTSMAGAIFAAAGLNAPVCGNIGTALSSAARREIVDGERPDAYLVEISSFQAHAIEHFRPRLAAILNIQPDHLDWHGTLDAYTEAKLRLVRNMGAGDWIVYNRDDAELTARLPRSDAGLVPFAFEPVDTDPPAAWVGDGRIWWWPTGSGHHALLAVDQLGVIGPHNQANACAAAALAMLFGVAADAVAAGLRGYRALEHRMERCGTVGGILCVNDSKATNIDATLAALAGFERGVWLILGGRDKGADFRQLLPLLDQRIAGILLIGEASDPIAAALAPSHAPLRCGTMDRAVEHALSVAAAGDTLLLSPACTSFDQYGNFEERGRHFKTLVAARAAGLAGAVETATEDI